MGCTWWRMEETEIGEEADRTEAGNERNRKIGGHMRAHARLPRKDGRLTTPTVPDTGVHGRLGHVRDNSKE
ncbi:hypothetical protein H6P81_007028 [Aristolochia fimbriata]|uniref:Uncharacterized protein n=1 Tax=Aristolochia fimbriata TaxID=158543 RepID=A0AAV7EZS4_ARIFI|nr:hypothetical protein H6P81_007028 [Aristolochia fimbriata]